jgi:glutathione peroxidase
MTNPLRCRWLLCLPLWWAGMVSPAAATTACPELLQHSLPRLQDEQPVDLCRYAGQVLLVVNTASHCGFTPQYQALEALHRTYGPRGLVVLGFPSNDFGRQEPGTNAQVADFCQNQFDVRFPMFAKSEVRGASRSSGNPLYAALAARTGEAPGWNFHKYLVSADGQQVVSVPSAVNPQDPGLIAAIEKMLSARTAR